jgi:4-amino-4-deoxy-L-arabinose transferase-like glycosyltransferase
MLFAALLTSAMAVAVEILQKPQPGPISRIAFGFFLGAAVLAKGPAAVILAGGATLLWAALSRQWRAPFRFLHPLIIAVFCATALPWYFLCALRNPDFLRVFIWQHNFERYVTPVFQHPQPFWFFGPIFLLGILPWLQMLFTVFLDADWSRHFRISPNSPALFIACWSVFTLLFFTLSESKLPGYILPAIPPSILLLARSLQRQIDRETKAIQVLVASVGIVLPLLIGIVYARPHLTFGPGIGFNPDPLRGLRVAFGAALVGGGFIVAFALYRKWNGAVSIAACTIAALLLVANRMVMPGVDTFISARPAAMYIINRAKPDEVAVYQLPRAYEYGLNYYFGTELPKWTPENKTAKYLFLSSESEAPLNQSSQFFNQPAGAHFPATSDGKIYVLIGRQSRE